MPHGVPLLRVSFEFLGSTGNGCEFECGPVVNGFSDIDFAADALEAASVAGKDKPIEERASEIAAIMKRVFRSRDYIEMSDDRQIDSIGVILDRATASLPAKDANQLREMVARELTNQLDD